LIRLEAINFIVGNLSKFSFFAHQLLPNPWFGLVKSASIPCPPSRSPLSAGVPSKSSALQGFKGEDADGLALDPEKCVMFTQNMHSGGLIDHLT
jgi:hypothetical protein